MNDKNNINALERMYREVMQDHYKNPRTKGLIGFDISSHKRNPSCGDDITVELVVEDGVVKDVRQDGVGCLICMSSASVMSEVVKGKKVTEALLIMKNFYNMEMNQEFDEEILDEAIIYKGVSQFPARIKCACLPWKALGEALGSEDEEDV